MGGGDVANAYFCTVNVNHLVFQIFISRSDAPQGYALDRSQNSRFVRPLWPLTYMPVGWPPDGIVPYDQLESFADAFITA